MSQPLGTPNVREAYHVIGLHCGDAPARHPLLDVGAFWGGFGWRAVTIAIVQIFRLFACSTYNAKVLGTLL